MTTSPTPPTDLGTFDGMTVIGTKVNIKRAGDGLSQSLAVAPQLLHSHERRYVLMEVVVGPVRMDPVKDTTDMCIRVHDLIAQTVTLVDAEMAADTIRRQAEAIEAAKGIQTLDFTAGDVPAPTDADAEDEA